MAYRWACDSCGQLHGRNPSRCRDCGATVFTPISRERLAEATDQRPATVESLDPDDVITYGTTPDPEFPSSPDVAPDGSIGEPETTVPGDDGPSRSRRRGWSAFAIIVTVLILCLGLAVALLAL